MRLALFAPVNHPARREGREALRLARALARRAELTVFIRPDPTRRDVVPDDLDVAHQRRFEDDAAERRYDHALYVLHDDAFTSEYVGRMLRTEAGNVPGGVVLFKDGTLQHYYQTTTLYLGDARHYREVMAHAHGELGDRAAAGIVAGTGHESLFRQLGLLPYFTEASAAVLVHESDLSRVARSYGGLLRPLVARVPRGTEVRGASWSERVRELADLGLADRPGPAVLVALGDMPGERDLALAVAARLLAGRRPVRIVLRGGAVPGDRRDLRRPEVAWCPPPDPATSLSAWDLVVDVRDPTPGHVQAELLTWMGAGVPVVASDFAALSHVPRGALGRLETLDALGRWLEAEPRRRLGEAGRRWVLEASTDDHEADAIVAFLDAHGPELVQRKAALGSVQHRFLSRQNATLHRRLRDQVFAGMPIDQVGDLGGGFVAEVERELEDMGLRWDDAQDG